MTNQQQLTTLDRSLWPITTQEESGLTTHIAKYVTSEFTLSVLTMIYPNQVQPKKVMGYYFPRAAWGISKWYEATDSASLLALYKADGFISVCEPVWYHVL